METKTEIEQLKIQLNGLKAILNSSINDIENLSEHTWGELRSGRIILDEALENLKEIEKKDNEGLPDNQGLQTKLSTIENILRSSVSSVQSCQNDNYLGQETGKKVEETKKLLAHTAQELTNGYHLAAETIDDLATIDDHTYSVLIRVKGGIVDIVAKHWRVDIEVRDYDNEPSLKEFSEQEIKAIEKPENMIDEIALVTAIISDNYCDLLYGKFGGYITTVEKIVVLAKDFYQEFKHIDWEAALNDEYPPDKKEYFETDNCWDSVIITWTKIQIDKADS